MLVDRNISIVLFEIRPVLTESRARTASELDRVLVIHANCKVVRSTIDADSGLEETAVNSISNSNWIRKRGLNSKVFAFNCYSSSCILVLNSEGSVYKSFSSIYLIWIDSDALISDTEHLDGHLVMGDPWSDLDSVGHNECVVIMRADITESDCVWLGSSSSHAENLIAIWIIEEVLVLPGVGHEEGVAWSIFEGIVAPFSPGVIVIRC